VVKMDEKSENMMRARELINELVQTNIERFNYYGFLSVQWWILLSFLVVPWIIWIKVADKKRTLEIVLVGALVLIVTIILDLVGYYLSFWDYSIEILPLIPGGFPFDFSMIPVAYMLIYQYFKTWKSYCIALVCMSLIYAFIGEPFSNSLELVIYIKWRYIYSVEYYILTGITVRAIVAKLTRMSVPVAK
jgi:hypothetical protein